MWAADIAAVSTHRLARQRLVPITNGPTVYSGSHTTTGSKEPAPPLQLRLCRHRTPPSLQRRQVMKALANCLAYGIPVCRNSRGGERLVWYRMLVVMTRNRDGWPGWVTWITVFLTLLHENGLIHNIVWTLNIYRFKQPIGDFFVFIIDDDDRRTGRQRTSDVIVNRKLRTDELLQSQLFFSANSGRAVMSMAHDILVSRVAVRVSCIRY
jgi:hypothetical protein